MKKAKILAVLVTLAMTMCACGNESSKVENEVEQEVNISSENIINDEEIKEDEVLIEESEEIKEDELEIWGINQTEFDIEQVIGEYTPDSVEINGITYSLFSNGGVFAYIKAGGTIQEKVEINGKIYPVVGIGGVNPAITELTIPSFIKYIKDRAFSQSSISRLVIPDTVVYIAGNTTFADSKIEELILPDNYRTDNEWEATFAECENLKSPIKVSDDVKIMSSAFAGCANLPEVKLSSNLEVLNYNVFKECTSLQELTLPDSLTTIKQGVFSGTNLKKLILPDNLTNLDLLCFDFMPNLEELIIPDSVTEYISSHNVWITPSMKKIKYSNSAQYKFHDFRVDKVKNDETLLNENSELTIIFPDSLSDLDQNYFFKLDARKVTIHVAPDYVEHFRNKFPNITVVAKE